MGDRLKKIRTESETIITIKQKFIRVLLAFVLGAVSGFIAKYTDIIPSNGINGTWILSIIGVVGTYLGVWILACTILAAWGRSPIAAAVHVFSFILGMLIAYYLYSAVLFGFFPKHYFIAWSAIALLSPIYAYIVWYSRGNGWVSAICAAIPISLLLLEGYTFYYTYSIAQGFDLFFAILLFVFLPKGSLQRLRLLPCLIVMFLITWRLELMSFIFSRV